MELSLDYDKSKRPEDLSVFFSSLPQIFQGEIMDGLDHASRSFLKRFQKEKLHGPFGTNVVSRGGKGSFFRRFQRRPNFKNLSVDVRTSSKAAMSLETGAVISKGAPVPLYGNEFMFDRTSGRHTLKKEYRAKLHNGELIKVKAFNGQQVLMDPETKQALFILKRSVRIPKRLGYMDTFNKHQGRITEILNKTIDTVLLNVNNPNYNPKKYRYSAKRFK